MSQLAKAIPTASFEVGRSQLTYSVNRILKLISDSIESGNPITAQDVREAYCDFAMKARRHRAGLVWVPEKGKYRYAQTRKEWMEHYCKEYKAIQWFRSNLGSAILKGKLMVIPVIDID